MFCGSHSASAMSLTYHKEVVDSRTDAAATTAHNCTLPTPVTVASVHCRQHHTVMPIDRR